MALIALKFPACCLAHLFHCQAAASARILVTELACRSRTRGGKLTLPFCLLRRPCRHRAGAAHRCMVAHRNCVGYPRPADAMRPEGAFRSVLPDWLRDDASRSNPAARLAARLHGQLKPGAERYANGLYWRALLDAVATANSHAGHPKHAAFCLPMANCLGTAEQGNGKCAC